MASSIDASTSGAGGVITTADNTGILQLKSGGTTIATISSTGITTQVGAPAFSAYLSSQQTISSATWTKVQCSTEDFDTNSNYDNATNYRFTPTVAGYYQINISANGQASTGVVTRVICAIYKNGSIYRRKGDISALYGTTGSDVVYCNGSTDYIEMYGYIATTGTATINASEGSTAFSGAMIRSA
jgi:hypothetical protein